MKSRKNVRIVTIALVGVVLLAAVGWAAAKQIKSPAQIAADTAAPKASLITATVTRQTLKSEIITRGTVRFGLPTPISLPTSQLKTGSPIVGRIPKPGDKLREGAVAMTVSGRPMIVLKGDSPMHRDLKPGDKGEDVLQLERALARKGLPTGAVDGTFDGSTAAGVAQLYRSIKSTPFGATETQIDKVNTAAQAFAAAEDKTLQARLALRTAQRGTPKADVNQARLDATSVSETIATTRAAIAAARGKVRDARDLAEAADRQAREGDPTAKRDLATAVSDVTAKENALRDAQTAQDEAQRALNALPADATPQEVEAARSTLRIATAKVPNARSDLAASQQAQIAAENAVRASGNKGREDGRKARRDGAVAASDLRQAQKTLQTLQRKRALARQRVGILREPLPSGVEQDAVAAARREEARAHKELSRLALGIDVQVPADEILFVPSTPALVDQVTAKRGTPATGDLMTITNTRLVVDAALSVEDGILVKAGRPVTISAPDQQINITGTVTFVAKQSGTNGVDPGKRYVEITPHKAPTTLQNSSVALKIAVESSKGAVLTVPFSAVSSVADGSERVEVALGGGRTKFVTVTTGLSAQGFYEVAPVRAGELKVGDRVIIGSGSSAPAAKAPTGSSLPTTPPPAAGTSTSGSTGTGTTGSTGSGTGTGTTGSAGAGSSTTTTGP
ncbi:MAG: hypothetical protein QOF69_127 [Solirubrobacteraceae bacterium]|jgi:hypothetical protein|nr:hypothetical protein [Solirubrobacteraceae bacterium]